MTSNDSPTTNLTVPVPAERTAEFFQFFGLWLAGSLALNPTPVETSGGMEEPAQTPAFTAWGSSDADLVDAALLWEKFSKRARAMFSLLIDNPDKRFTGEEIAEAADIPNGAHGVAGVLAWPGRHGQAIGRGLPSQWVWDEDSEESVYWMSQERADLFRAAREKFEGNA